MAVGDVTDGGWLRTIELLTAATATNSPPSGASAGVDIDTLIGGERPRAGAITVASTAGSGTMTVTIRLWGYRKAGLVWVPLGAGYGATKGTINGGGAIDMTGTAMIRHAEPVDMPAMFQRVYAEITAIGGTATAISAWLTVYQGGD